MSRPHRCPPAQTPPSRSPPRPLCLAPMSKTLKRLLGHDGAGGARAGPNPVQTAPAAGQTQHAANTRVRHVRQRHQKRGRARHRAFVCHTWRMRICVPYVAHAHLCAIRGACAFVCHTWRMRICVPYVAHELAARATCMHTCMSHARAACMPNGSTRPPQCRLAGHGRVIDEQRLPSDV
eukprot:364512-Chlamydomonas_euryale.AAC.11